MTNKWQPQTAEETLRRFEADILPAFGHLPFNKVHAPDVLDAIRAIEKRAALEIANRQTANRSRWTTWRDIGSVRPRQPRTP
jgi:hypothetical protein